MVTAALCMVTIGIQVAARGCLALDDGGTSEFSLIARAALLETGYRPFCFARHTFTCQTLG